MLHLSPNYSRIHARFKDAKDVYNDSDGFDCWVFVAVHPKIPLLSLCVLFYMFYEYAIRVHLYLQAVELPGLIVMLVCSL